LVQVALATSTVLPTGGSLPSLPGPLQSGFGLHLVRVDDRKAGAMPAFEQIRPIVLREWQSGQRTKSNKAFLDSLRAKYDIRVEGEAAALFAQPADSGGTPIK
jgi:parvulin-like peptidyl-prolyl isomerase